MTSYEILARHYHNHIVSSENIGGCDQIRIRIPHRMKASDIFQKCGLVLRKHNYKMIQSYVDRQFVGHTIEDGHARKIIRSYVVVECRKNRKKIYNGHKRKNSM